MKLRLLIAVLARVALALDADAPASLVDYCAVPASAYAIRACEAESLNLAHGDPALRPLSEREAMGGVMLASGPQAACVECLSAIDAIAGRRRRLAPRGDRAVYKEPLNRKLITDHAGAARRLHDASRLIRRARSARSPWRAAALASTARLLLHAVNEKIATAAPFELRTAISDLDGYHVQAIALPDPELAKAHALPIEYKLQACPPRKVDASTIAAMEPLLPSGRNLDFRELGLGISFHPYRVLPQIKATPARRHILIDVGGNEWLGSPKALLDQYIVAGAPFDEAHIFEPNDLDAPQMYNNTTAIHVHKIAVDVGSRNDNDILQWLQDNVGEEDFVALKFDVDNDFSVGPTMEWGFLADLLHTPEPLALVDELSIELHFYAPSLRWVHLTHSMKQGFDVFAPAPCMRATRARVAMIQVREIITSATRQVPRPLPPG